MEMSCTKDLWALITSVQKMVEDAGSQSSTI